MLGGGSAGRWGGGCRTGGRMDVCGVGSSGVVLIHGLTGCWFEISSY